MRSLLQCRVIALLLAAALLSACGGGATSSGVGTPGGGGQGLNINPNLSGLTLACVDVEACAGITLIPPEGLAPPEPGFIAGAQDPETNALLGDYSSLQSALVEAVTVTATTFAAGATVTVNGATVASGSASPPLTLVDGENVITIVVTSANGQNTRTYRIFIDRISRDNADLATLTLSSGPLSPAFARDTLDYETTVPYNVLIAGCACVRVTLRPVEAGATIVVTGATLAPVDAGLQSTPIPLVVGENAPIEVRVTSLSEAVEQVYRITVTRIGNADLASITVTGFTLEPPPDDEVPLSLESAFASDTTNYNVMAENRIETVELSVVAREAASGAEVVSVEQVLQDDTVIDITPAPGEPAGFQLQPFNEEDPDSALNRVRIRVSHPFGPLAEVGEGEEDTGARDPVTRTYNVTVIRQRPPLFEPEAYLKPVVAGPGYRFGHSVALSADGDVLAIGAPGAPGPGGGERGAVFIYELENGDWVSRVTLPGPVEAPCSEVLETCDPFGFSVALSADGNVLAVGAPSETTAEERLNDFGIPDIEVTEHGWAYLFTRVIGGSWSSPSEPIPIEPFETGIGFRFGHSVALGQTAPGGPYTLAVGVPGDSGDRDSGVNEGTQVPEDPPEGSEVRGAVFVHTCAITGSDLDCGPPEALIKPPEDPRISATPEQFGASLAFSTDGNVLAIGAPGTGGPVGTGGLRGTVYVHERNGSIWGGAVEAVRTMGPRTGDEFGRSVALSGAGDLLVVGMPGQISASSGVGASPDLSQGTNNIGAAIVFTLEEDEQAQPNWVQQVFIKPSNSRNNFRFGASVALSADGRSLAVGAPRENSLATTVDGNQRLVAPQLQSNDSGAIYQFRSILDPEAENPPPWCQVLVNVPQGQPWCQTAFIKTPNSRRFNQYGTSIAIAQPEAGLLVVGGAPGERSASTGDPELSGVIMGSVYPDDSTAINRGATYLHRAVEAFVDPEPVEDPPPDEE